MRAFYVLLFFGFSMLISLPPCYIFICKPWTCAT